jgi:uncharacterized protein (TIGR02145 family)
MKACPAGFHLADDDEWTALTDYVGGKMTAGTKLKSKTGWEEDEDERGRQPLPATDEYGFSALPGGANSGGITFYGAGYSGVWWSAWGGSARAWYRGMDYYHEYVDSDHVGKTDLFSVRCVQDSKEGEQ